MTHDRWVNVVKDGHNHLAIGSAALHDLLQLVKTPAGFRIAFGENNDGDARPLYYSQKLWSHLPSLAKLLVDESVESGIRKGVMEMRNEVAACVLPSEADEYVVEQLRV